MTTTTQHISPNPALDFANAVLEETDGAREIIYMLHDIAQGVRENATTNDRMKASGILMDRGLGKCPKQPPVLSQACPEPSRRACPEPSRRVEGPAPGPNPSPAPETEACPEPAEEGRGACPERKPVLSLPKGRRVTQIDRSLHDSLGPPPSARPEGNTAASPESFDPYSIQQHILEITDGCRTLMTVLTDIYRAPDDDPKVKESHRVKAGQMLIDRLMGANPALVQDLVCPDCRQMWTTHPDSSAHPEPVEGDSTSDSTSEEFVPDPKWVAALHEIKRMEDEGILTPDPNARKFDLSFYMPPEDYKFDPAEVKARVAEFDAKLELQAERRAKWPEIEERRRKKLAQIYPSHSDDDPPDT